MVRFNLNKTLNENKDALSGRITTHCAIYSCKLHLQTQVELQLSRCHVVSSSLRLVRKCRRFHSNWTRLIHLLVPFLVRDSTWGLLVCILHYELYINYNVLKILWWVKYVKFIYYEKASKIFLSVLTLQLMSKLEEALCQIFVADIWTVATLNFFSFSPFLPCSIILED